MGEDPLGTFFDYAKDKLGFTKKKLKTLKISVVATLALTLAWWLRVPHRIWPGHPVLADFFMGLVLCVLLQVLWVEPKASVKK